MEVLGEIAIEAFTCMLLFKNLFSFGLTWIALSWLYKNDIVGTFNILGSVQIGVCLLSVPMCKLDLIPPSPVPARSVR